MPSDDERDSRTKNLTERDGFVAWKRNMRLVAMDKGDVYGLFDEDGTKGTYATATADSRKERRQRSPSFLTRG